MWVGEGAWKNCVKLVTSFIMRTLHRNIALMKLRKSVWHEASMGVMNAFRILVRILARKDIKMAVRMCIGFTGSG